MSHRGRSAQLCPEKERGETDRVGDRAAVSLRESHFRSGLKIDSILSVFLKNGYFTRKRNDVCGPVYSSNDLLKHNQAKITFFILRNLYFWLLNLADMRFTFVKQTQYVVNKEFNAFFVPLVAETSLPCADFGVLISFCLHIHARKFRFRQAFAAAIKIFSQFFLLYRDGVCDLIFSQMWWCTVITSYF